LIEEKDKNALSLLSKIAIMPDGILEEDLD